MGLSLSRVPRTGVGSPLAELRRPKTDTPASAGVYDFDLRFTPDELPSGPPPPGAPPLPPIDLNGPSIFTALQEQLGLTLESQKGPVEVIVIDSAEHPTEN